LSFFKELKRRNVLRVGVAYTIAGWLIVQVVETLFPIYGLSDAAIRLVVTLLAIGLLPVLVLAWAFELTPEGLKKDKDVDRSQSITLRTGKKLDRMIMVALALALGLFAFDKFVLSKSRETAQQQQQEEQLASATEEARQEGRSEALVKSYGDKSIAVLPFLNMSDDASNEYFSDGISEEILNLLGRIPSLKVIGRTSSFGFKGKNEDLRVIGQKLGVRTLLEGSVRKSGDRVRITAQLIDVADGAQMWSEIYDRDLTDIFAVQDDVAAAIIDALRLHVGTVPTRGRPTNSTEAYSLFLRARVLFNTHKGMEAVELLSQAVALDPNFAEAFELQAISYWTESGVIFPIQEGFALSGEAAAAALAIDPGLSFAQAIYHLTVGQNRSYVSGIEALQRAWRENPNNPAPLRSLIYQLEYAGYLRQAHHFARQWVDVEPLAPMANYSLGETLFSIGQLEKAMAPLNFAYDLDEGFASWFVPDVHLIEGRDEIAISQYEASLGRAGISDTTWIRGLIKDARDPIDGLANVNRHIKQVLASIPDEQFYFIQGVMSSWYLPLGYLDEYYERLFAYGPNDQMATDADIWFWQGTVFRQGGFTSHPRYLEAAEALGVTDIWDKLGPPDFCEKSEGKWVCE
jgi:TolB-like protein